MINFTLLTIAIFGDAGHRIEKIHTCDPPKMNETEKASNQNKTETIHYVQQIQAFP